MKSAGIKWIHSKLNWSSVETTAGKYNFAAYDTLLAGCQTNGIRLHFSMDGGNALYTGSSTTLPSTATQLAALGNFVKAAVVHYKHLGILWEGTNEPDLFSNITQYEAINSTIVSNLRAASSDEWFGGPSISTPGRSVSVNFLQQCLNDGLLNNWDFVIVHGYFAGNEPELVGPQLQSLKTMIKPYAGTRTVPLMVGEWGYNEAWTPLRIAPSPVQVGGVNLLSSVNQISDPTWTGYWLKPPVAIGVKDALGGYMGWKCATADYSATAGNYSSGMLQKGAPVVGQWYTVSVYLRSEGAPLTLSLGLEDSNGSNVIIDNVWRRYYFTFQSKNAYSASRMFQIYEWTPSNTYWEFYGPQTEAVNNLTASSIAATKEATIAQYIPRMYKTCLAAGVPYMSIYSWREQDPATPGFGLLDASGVPTAKFNSLQTYYQSGTY